MSPIQQMLLGVGAVATKTYVDDVFSTYVYKGTGSSLSINNGIDVSGEGALVWLKSRSNSYGHKLTDTVRGSTKQLNSDAAAAQSTSSDFISGFTSTGFTLGTDVDINSSSHTYTSWTFRKTPGFFDVVTWTGNGTAGRTISHNLGSIPGCIMVKCTSTGNNWGVYHRSTKATHYLQLNTTNAAASDSGLWNNVEPTATNFTLGDGGTVNDNGDTYVAYVFAGGESTAATARSVDFDGSDDYLEISSHADLQLGTDDFTLEMWWNGSPSGSYTQCFGTQSQFDAYDGTWRIGTRFNSENRVYFARGNGSGFDEFYYEVNVNDGQWHHIACVRASNIVTIYIDGVAQGTPDWRSSSVPANRSITGTCSSSLDFWVGRQGRPSNIWAEGKMSNIRVVKGTAVYTSSFRPPTEPLTNITNTVVLICNNSSVTGSTVTPGTISSGGSPTASTDSPFDDPAAFTFGDAGDQNVIKCGSYVGNGSATGPEINLGWEPQWVLTKSSSGSYNWQMYDSMRGIVTGGNDPWLEPNTSDAEASSLNWLDLTSRGFKITESLNAVNKSGDTYIYIAIRRPDGYVGKPPELGTDVFAMDTGASTSANTIPDLDSSFPVDLALIKNLTQSQDWHIGTRLQGTKKLNTNLSASESTSSNQVWDSNLGCWKNLGSEYQGWMWKRHAGFTVCIWEGDGVIGRQIPHDMNKTVEMIWLKNRSSGSYNWMCYHKGLNGGTSPEDYFLRLNTTDAEASSSTYLNSTAPTSTHITLGSINAINADGNNFIAMLFASVDGISKVGSYTGNGSATERTITLGFQPRFLILKNANGGNNWFVFDTVRGWASGNDTVLSINSDAAQYSGEDYGAPTSTGFTLTSSLANVNENNSTYIYYAHA